VRKNYHDEMFAEPDPSSANTSPEFENEVYQQMQEEAPSPRICRTFRTERNIKNG
jgi:hypothetical protein